MPPPSRNATAVSAGGASGSSSSSNVGSSGSGGKGGASDWSNMEGEHQVRKETAIAMSASLRHEEEVQRHIETSNLAPHEIALYILQNGSAGQKISMCGHLSRTLKDCAPNHITRIISELNEGMWTQEVEMQTSAPPTLIAILGLLNEEQLLLLLNGTKTMLEVKTESIRKEWSALTLEMVPYLSPNALFKEMIPLALKKTEHTEPHEQRVLGCTLIGRLCKRLDANTIVNSILRRAMSLCQDTDTDIRVTMCAQLSEVARAIGLQLTKERITRELFELLVDEERLVSRAAFTALIDLVEFFDAPYRREHFYPIIKSYINSPPEDVLSLLIEEFGRFLWKIKSDVQSQDDVTLFASFFRQSAQKPDGEVRRMCAYNLPAVVASLPPTVYPTILSPATRSLANDSNPKVRRAIAAGLHELCPLLADKAAFHLKDVFVTLISDVSFDVRALLVAHLGPILDVFAQQLKGDEREQFFTAIAPHLVSYEAYIRKDWRKVSVFFDSFMRFPGYFNAATLHDKFLPVLYYHLVSGSAAVKDQCALLVVTFCRSMLKTNIPYVVEAFSKLVAEFGRSPSCCNRQTFTLLFKHAAGTYSRKCVRDRLIDPLLEAASDPIPNVRLQVVRVLPTARRILKPPMDTEAINAYTAALRKLQADIDPDVATELRVNVMPQLEAIEREFAQQAALRTSNTADDIADRQLEDGEGNLLEVAKEQEKLERRAKLRELLRTDPGTGGPAGAGPASVGNPALDPRKPKPRGSSNVTGKDVPSSGLTATAAAGTGAVRSGRVPSQGPTAGASGVSRTGAGGVGPSSSTRTSSTSNTTMLPAIGKR